MKGVFYCIPKCELSLRVWFSLLPGDNGQMHLFRAER